MREEWKFNQQCNVNNVNSNVTLWMTIRCWFFSLLLNEDPNFPWHFFSSNSFVMFVLFLEMGNEESETTIVRVQCFNGEHSWLIKMVKIRMSTASTQPQFFVRDYIFPFIFTMDKWENENVSEFFSAKMSNSFFCGAIINSVRLLIKMVFLFFTSFEFFYSRVSAETSQNETMQKICATKLI